MVGAVTVMVRVAVAPAARVASPNVTVPEEFCTDQPLGCVLLTNTSPPGSESCTVTLLAAFGPLLVTVRVEVSRPLGRTLVGVADLVMARSACACVSPKL